MNNIAQAQTSATVDVRGAAMLLKIHPKTVLDLISDGVLPAAKIGKAYVLMTADVLKYLERRVIADTAARMRKVTKASPQDQRRAGSRSA